MSVHLRVRVDRLPIEPGDVSALSAQFHRRNDEFSHGEELLDYRHLEDPLKWWQVVWANFWRPGDENTRRANWELYRWRRDLRRQVKRDLRQLKREG